MQAELGPSQVGSSMTAGGMLTISDRIQNRYDLTIGVISEQRFEACDRPDCVWHIRQQIFAGAEFLVHDPWTSKWTLGLGPYFFQNQDRVGTTRFRMGLSIERRFGDRFGLRMRHFSNAGSGKEFTICREREGWRNVPLDTPGALCLTNDWNTGQDSWLRLVWYF